MWRKAAAALAFLSLASVAWSASAAAIRQKKFGFPSPIEWRVSNVEVSLVGVIWGPANSPEMPSKQRPLLRGEKPQFYPERSNALGLEFRARIPGLPGTQMVTGSGLVLVEGVNGTLKVPMELTPSGFLEYSGSPGTYDIKFPKSTSVEFWDFFPVSPDQREFLFQTFPHSGPMNSSVEPIISFKVRLNDNDIAVTDVTPAAQSECSDFRKQFAGSIGPQAEVHLELTRRGKDLEGTEQYTRIGKTLWLTGSADSFGNFRIEERYPKNHLTGFFRGTFSRGCRGMTGYFSKPDGSRLLPFMFREVNKTN